MMTMLDALPSFAFFTHSDVRDGFESVCFRPDDQPFRLEGGTAAVEDGVPWSVQYRVAVDDGWRTTYVEAAGISPSGHHATVAEVRDGRWWVDGALRPDLDGCVDIDFESSLVTNTLAVHRTDIPAGTSVEVPAAFVRADDLRVQRVEQTYSCLENDPTGAVFDYSSTTFDFACRLVFDASGLVVDYPGIGRRSG